MVVDVNWNTNKQWQWKCFKIADVLMPALNPQPKDGKIINIRHMKFQNKYVDPIYIDELRIGKIRGSSFNMIQTKKALSFDGQVPKKFNIWRNRARTWGSYVRIHIDNWDAVVRCGYQVNLPTILPPDGAYTVTGNTNTVLGNDWTNSNPAFKEPHGDFITGQLVDTAPKDYGYMRLNYKRNADNSRFVSDTFVMRRSQSPQDMDVTVDIRYGDSTEVLTVRLNHDFQPAELKEKIRETWPELGEDGLNVDSYRGGWCNPGYEYYIRANEHGNMKEFTVSAKTLHNTRNPNARFENKIIVRSAVMTAIMPGSVMQTPHHVPQVVVTANGQRSACHNCDFEYKNNLTPEVQSVTTSGGTVTMGDDISVTFSVGAYMGSFDELSISLGNAELADCSLTDTLDGEAKIVTADCKVGQTGTGSGLKVFIDLPELGQAESTDTFEVVSSISDYSPKNGSPHGGTIVTVDGSGFLADQVVTIKIGGSDTECDSAGFEVTYSKLTCRTRANSGISASNVPTMDSVTQTKFSVIGGERFTIQGSNFSPEQNCDDSKVYIASSIAKVISWTDSEIVAESVSAAPENGNLQVYVCNIGFANAESGKIQLVVNSVSGAFSSLLGGRKLEINGFGFQNQADGKNADSLAVKVGDIPCEITETAYNKLVCETGAHNNQVEIKITAKGFVDSRTGKVEDIIEVEAGQEVVWKWMISIPGTTPVIELQRTPQKGNFLNHFEGLVFYFLMNM